MAVFYGRLSQAARAKRVLEGEEGRAGRKGENTRGRALTDNALECLKRYLGATCTGAT